MLAAGIAAAGCAAKRPVQAAAAAEVQIERGQEWQLVSLGGKEVSRSRHLISLTFNPETGRLHGRGPCNEFSATYFAPTAPVSASASGLHPIRIGEVEQTAVRCPDAGDHAEQRHLAMLSKVDAYQLSPLTLTLFRKGKAVLTYELR